MRKLICFIAFLIAFYGCASLQNTVKVTPDQIPPDFKNYDDTLLVIDDKLIIGYSKFLKSNFSKYYTGKYKIITAKEYRNAPGNNFRFVFNGTIFYEMMGTDRQQLIQYTLGDTRTGKQYKTPQTKYYSELMINYIKALDEQRKKQ